MTDIGWRSTSVRALANNLIIVPNCKLAQAIVTNYYLPEKRLGVNFQVGPCRRIAIWRRWRASWAEF